MAGPQCQARCALKTSQLPPVTSRHHPCALARCSPQVTLGWAWTDRYTFEAFGAEVAAAPPGLRPALALLLQLYGLSRIEAGAECYLSTGGLPGCLQLQGPQYL